MYRTMIPCRAVVAAMVLAAVAIAPSAAAGPDSCPGDADASRVVDFADVLAVLSVWGPCPGCPEDFDGSGVVDVTDLLVVLASWGPCPDPVPLEMAGRSLGAYPHFDFVRAFNEGAIVEIAIDPAHAPGPGPCDVYVVADRTADEWASDPALTDVRLSGSQPATFDGATIQDNTFTLTGSGTLDGERGTFFGVDYDLVCDCNRNGVLDAADLIDGLDDGGFTVVRSTTSLGPLMVASVNYSGGTFLGQRTWYPSGIATMGELPLVVVSHGNGHLYTWYDYLQEHLASFGYVVMSHQNNTQPGIETASTTTLENTDYFLGNLGTIAGGIFDGHIDASRITWIGHSRGGEGVARAYDRLFDGAFVPDHYSIDDIRLVSSIAPNDYLGRLRSNPHGVAYHLLIGAADGDNGGWPNRESDAPFHVYERAEGYRQATNVHGADHNDFNCCGINDFRGPPGTAIGRAEAQRVAKAVYLALIKHYIDGSRAARDFLWRQYEVLRPLGIDADTIVDREYVEAPHAGLFVIDDFQSEPSLGTSSSGGAVTGDVLSRFEGQHVDTDGTFTWSAGDPMNGMSRGRPDDLSNGTVFDWSPGADRFLEWEVVPLARDLTDEVYLTFRACQGTRHPETVAEIGDTSFTVTLRDGSGGTSSIEILAYGAGLQEPYQRTGSGSGAGWQNEYETIRVRLTDFLHNGATLDLTDVVAVRFDVGSSYGSSRGRVAVDDLALSRDEMPAATGPQRVRRRVEPDPPAPDEVRLDVPPAPVLALVHARPFVLDQGYVHDWRGERPDVDAGHLLVLRVDPALVYPRQSREPVLYVGDQTAERVNVGYPSGYVVAIVPGPVDLETARVWFGAPALPERVGAARIAEEHARAAAAGIAPLVRRGDGPTLRLATKRELLRHAAGLIERYSPQERDLVNVLRMPR